MDLGDEADNGVTETPQQQQQQQQPNQIDLNELIAKAIKAYEDGKKRKISPEGSDAEQGSSNNLNKVNSSRRSNDAEPERKQKGRRSYNNQGSESDSDSDPKTGKKRSYGHSTYEPEIKKMKKDKTKFARDPDAGNSQGTDHDVSSDEDTRGLISDADENRQLEIEVRAPVDHEFDSYLKSDAEEDTETDFLENLCQEFAPVEEDIGEAIPEKLAKMVDDILKIRMSKEDSNSLMSKFPRPKNASLLVTPRVTEFVWSKLNHQTKQTDTQLSRVGEFITKGLTANVGLVKGLTDLIGKLPNEEAKQCKELTRTALQIIRLNAGAMHTLSSVRRGRMRNDLGNSSNAFKALCKPPEKEGIDLFGENVAERLKEIKEMGRMGNDLIERKFPTGRPNFKSEYNGFKTMCDAQEVLHDNNICHSVSSRRVPVPERGPKRKNQRSNTQLHEKTVQGPALLQEPKTKGKWGENPQIQLEVSVPITDAVWEIFKCNTMQRGREDVRCFRAGKLRNHVDYWKSLTSDPQIIKMIKGTKIELERDVLQDIKPTPYVFMQGEREKIHQEIQNLLKKGVIVKSKDSDGYVSNIFTREKSDGTLRIILDLSHFNEHVVYRHFKMDNLSTAVNLMTEGCFMASIDWKDAYYSVPICLNHQKFLKFEWQGQMYQYTCYPNGLSSAPRNFTKITKVLFTELRKKGYLSTSYIDDCLLFGQTVNECRQNVVETVKASENSGFVIHPEKSQLDPTNEINYLGFTLNSTLMTVRVTIEKALKIKSFIEEILKLEHISIKLLSQIVGKLVASLPGVHYGQLFYRLCDNYKMKS